MKNLYNSLIAVAIAAMTITGCSKDPENLTPDRGGFTLNLIADGQIAGDTRTEYDPALKNIKWSEGDVASFYVNTIFQEVTATLTDNIATFSLKGLTPGTLNIQGYYPMSAYWKEGGNKKTADKITAYAMTLPAAQTATTATFDPAADILIARDMDNVAVTEATKELSVRFGRPVAVSKFTYKITNSTLTASTEKVKSIALKVVSEGKYIAGNFYFNPTIGHFVEADGQTEAMPELDAFADAKSNEVVVTLSDQPAVNANFDGWFVTSPVLIEVADQLIFTITTDAGTVITKTVTPSKELQFTNTKLNTLTVNIDNSVIIEKADIAIYTCGFEAAEGFKTGTDYQSTTTTGAANMQWYTFHGTPSSTNPSGATGQNMQCRWYKGDSDLGYTQMTFDITKATYVTFNAASTNGLQVKAEYSTDQGTTWQNAETFTLTTTYGAPFKYTISSEGITARVKFSVVLPATTPTSTSRLYLDNVTLYGKEGGKIDIPATITATDITDIAATGGEFTKQDAYEVFNSASDVIVSAVDNTVVTAATATSNTLTYTVSPNYGTESRSGSITITLADDPTITKTITVTQSVSTFTIPETVLIPNNTTSTSFTILSKEFDWTISAPTGITVTPNSGKANGTAIEIIVSSDATNAEASAIELGSLIIQREGESTQHSIIINKEGTTASKAYTLVTEELVDWSGTYIIAHTTKAINGTLTNSTLQTNDVDIVNDKILGSSDIDAYAIIITQNSTGNYTLQFEADSQYIGYKSGTNVQLGTDPNNTLYQWKIKLQSNGTALITNVKTSTRFLGWNNTAGFKAYSTGNLSTYPQPKLYRLSN